jgi:hypothetical protein
MKDDEEHAEKAAPDSHLQKLAGIGHDRRREKKGFRDLDQFFTKGHIFENGPIRKSTELLEQCGADEESFSRHLISTNVKRKIAIPTGGIASEIRLKRGQNWLGSRAPKGWRSSSLASAQTAIFGQDHAVFSLPLLHAHAHISSAPLTY